MAARSRNAEGGFGPRGCAIPKRLGGPCPTCPHGPEALGGALVNLSTGSGGAWGRFGSVGCALPRCVGWLRPVWRHDPGARRVALASVAARARRAWACRIGWKLWRIRLDGRRLGSLGRQHNPRPLVASKAKRHAPAQQLIRQQAYAAAAAFTTSTNPTKRRKSSTLKVTSRGMS